MNISWHEILQGAAAIANFGAVIAVLLLRVEVRQIRKDLEKLEGYILRNSELKGESHVQNPARSSR